MKKILPIGIGTVLLLVIAGFLLFNRSNSSTPYSQTSPGSYNTTPSPSGASLKTYSSDKYRFTLEYPVKGLDPKNNIIDCGKFVSTNTTMFTPNETTIIDNISAIQVVNWNKSIDEYIASLGATGFYSTSKIMASGADDAIKIGEIQKEWTGEGYAPMGYVADIYQKDGKLFLIMLQQNFLNDGCINPKDLNDAPPSIDKTWRIEDHLRFY